MECKCYLGQMTWLIVVLQLALLSATIGDTAIQNVPEEGKPPDSPEIYAWSPWSSWSPCSRSCGRGVSVQKRYCLPRSKIAFLNTTLPPPVITVRVTRQVENCAGVARRYHECNTQPCPDASRDTRAEQCSEYDRWPFRGRFYTWVPYIDGNAPCVLNCRPLGQHFYASLALVNDGTPCTKPGVRAICVQGTCKVVGLDSVLADASNVELRCGHRLVTGLFTRPRLPLGYTYVATVPRGACRLNVTELVASENFIALKVTNGSYITNGEFAISSPGTFEAAGARFHYTRTGGRDTIFSLGPIYAPVDIMVLYTQPTPNIRYEYFTESLPGEVKTFVKVNATDMLPPPHVKHTRRHHFSKVPEYTSITDLFLNSGRRHEKKLEENQIGLRRFTWKISSFSQCTRTCGGGIQIGKYRCIEGVDKEVSSVHCVGSPPSSRRRRCNNAPCPPRWRAAAWSVCPMCGPANRTRIVGCVQDHAKGIIKIKDRMCPDTKPVAFELCEIPDCESFETKRSFTSTASYEKNVTENFREGPIYTVSVNSSNANDIGPEYNYSPTIGWIYTEWSDCVGACGFSGVQSRGARCADPAGCGPRTADTVRACTVLQPCRATEGQWLVSEWSACSSDCGGWQARVVLCVGGAGAGAAGAAGGTGGSVLPAAACAGEQPPSRRGCGSRCTGRHTWYYSEWTKCIGNCSSGIGWKQRSVVCATVGQEEAPAGARPPGAAPCAAAAPDTRQPCALACADSAEEPVLKPWLATSTTESSESTFRVSLQRCEDQLPNCGLAVQARLCHYNYYTKNCCQSCKGRN